MTFENLNLDPLILKALEELNFITPTPIQEQAIPEVLKGRDMMASADTGTGKTASFILPALNRLSEGFKGRGPRILILVPTRELAIQVSEEAMKYSKYLRKVKTVCIYGGMPYARQNKEISRPYDILIATPGRLIDHLERGRINLSNIEIFILDEADRMLDMGFVKPVQFIAGTLPKEHQTLLFSATLKGPILSLAKELLKDPLEIDVTQDTAKPILIEQRLHTTDNLGHKHRLLSHLLNDPSVHQAIIFISTKFHADELAERLIDEGYPAAALHGDMNQRQRTRTLNLMRQEKIRFLVATDVAARGIDVRTISHVINFDLPMNPEDYVHRIGRTGRAGATGVALSFATLKEMGLVRRIEKFTGQKIPSHTIPGMEPSTRMEENNSRKRPSRFNRPKRNFRPRSGSGSRSY